MAGTSEGGERRGVLALVNLVRIVSSSSRPIIVDRTTTSPLRRSFSPPSSLVVVLRVPSPFVPPPPGTLPLHPPTRPRRVIVRAILSLVGIVLVHVVVVAVLVLVLVLVVEVQRGIVKRVPSTPQIVGQRISLPPPQALRLIVVWLHPLEPVSPLSCPPVPTSSDCYIYPLVVSRLPSIVWWKCGIICSSYGSPIIPPYDIDVGWLGRSIKGTPVSLFNGTHHVFPLQIQELSPQCWW